ncbi:hypothetical protein GCM10023310_66290 [Paenibacillus vulneris]|uniref:Histidine kinase n=1 Tax=Paenibacillus vulneris TaxID=1133364 RepID=A0ABW3UH16_9BACL
MSLLLPVTTLILIGIGAFCIFVSMEHDRLIRESTRRKRQALLSATASLSFNESAER